MRTKGLMKYHGGCSYKFKWLHSLFPTNYENYVYVEPFLGAGAVLLNKKPSTLYSFCGDTNYDITCLFFITQNFGKELIDSLSLLKYDKNTFNYFLNKPREETDLPLDIAIRKFVIHQQSRGGLGKTFAWSERFRRGMPGDVSGWLSAIENLEKVQKKLIASHLRLYHGDYRASFVFRNEKLQHFYFLDPPFLPKTRTAKRCYENEMTEKEHLELLTICKGSPDKIMLLGYDNEIYNGQLHSWNKVQRKTVNHSGQNKKKQERIDTVWMNY